MQTIHMHTSNPSLPVLHIFYVLLYDRIKIDKVFEIGSNKLLLLESSSQLLYQAMQMFSSCLNATDTFFSAFEEQAILEGTSDVIVIKHKNQTYTSTGFLACFGPYVSVNRYSQVKFYINGTLITSPACVLNLDRHGYTFPLYFSSTEIDKLGLNFGRNTLRYQLNNINLDAEIYLYGCNDKLLLSDVDGTLTKNDVGGLLHNIASKQYLHPKYAELIRKVADNGYGIVWVTMRSLPLYAMSKAYIKKTVGVDGPLIAEPEQFLPAIKKEIFHQTKNVKANIINHIRQAFPKQTKPFIAGLGNRENDAIAYLHAGIPLDSIFVINADSQVQQMSTDQQGLTYEQMLANAQKYFPKYSAPKVGY